MGTALFPEVELLGVGYIVSECNTSCFEQASSLKLLRIVFVSLSS
ncbi:hypothetical protein ACHAWT_001959 [Skeletonema menzelii]